MTDMQNKHSWACYWIQLSKQNRFNYSRKQYFCLHAAKSQIQEYTSTRLHLGIHFSLIPCYLQFLPKLHKQICVQIHTRKRSILICNIDTYMHISVSCTNNAEPRLSHAPFSVGRQIREQGRKASWIWLLIPSTGFHHTLHTSTLQAEAYICQQTQIYDTASSQRPLLDSILKIQDTEKKRLAMLGAINQVFKQ